MAIHILGSSFYDLKSSIHEGKDAHDRGNEARVNIAETMMYNIQAAKSTGRTLIDQFPDMRIIEKDICSWF